MKVVYRVGVTLRDGRVLDDIPYLLVNNPRNYSYAIRIEILDTVMDGVEVYESYQPNFFHIMRIMRPYGFFDALSRDDTSVFIGISRTSLKFLELVEVVKCRRFSHGHELLERWTENRRRVLKSRFVAIDEFSTFFRGEMTRDGENVYIPYWSLYNVCRDIKDGWFEDKFYFPHKRVGCGVIDGDVVYDIINFEVSFNDVAKARALLAKEITLNPLGRGIRG